MVADLPGVAGLSALGGYLVRLRYSVFVAGMLLILVLHTGALAVDA